MCGCEAYLKSNSGNITDGMTFSAETSHQHFIVLLNVIQTTIAGYESCDLLAVLDQLNTNALPDS